MSPPTERTTSSHSVRAVGAPPGIDHLELSGPPGPDAIGIQLTRYTERELEHVELSPQQLVEEIQREPSTSPGVRWINVDGHHPWIVAQLQKNLGFHTLAAEDVLHVPQRPGTEAFEDHFFVKMRLLSVVEGELAAEQIAIFAWKHTVVTIQEHAGDAWNPLRRRLRRDNSRLRCNDGTFLLYALIDAVVDHGFPVLEHYSDRLELLEEAIMSGGGKLATLQELHRLRRDLSVARRSLWPTREVVEALMRDEHDLLSERAQTFMRDVHTHVVQLAELLESQRELCASLADLHMSQVSNRTNDIMKVLTIMASLFIPITFLAGVYGMNFETIPELTWRWAYPTFWGTCGVIVLGLLWFFRRREWL